MDDGNSTTTRLLTLLNVSAIKAGKRKRAFEEDLPATTKLNKRRSLRFAESDFVPPTDLAVSKESTVSEPIAAKEPETEEIEAEESLTSYEDHFGNKPKLLVESSRKAVDAHSWKISQVHKGKLGTAYESVPEGSVTTPIDKTVSILQRLKIPFISRQAKLSQDQKELQNDLLKTLSSNRDLYLASVVWEQQKCIREAITLHALNHVTKKRRRILKNNERIAHASDSDPPEDVQDQGFTRPSILFLLPFRSSALNWLNALISHTPAPDFQVENHSRFLSEYGLPPGAVDKLASSEPGEYPVDHVETFKGNVDDSFRLGIKATRKSIKLFSEFYGSDILIASPLGLRMSIEKEKNADFLSSIEILVVDRMDVMTMQNWEHVQFIFSNLNKMPKESHNTDFSRIRPWYLDGHAHYLRQSILLSAYETPETRALFNSGLSNVAGKIRTENRWSPVGVPEGVQQNFVQFECSSPKDEMDKRFNHFTTQMLPAIMKSAVQSTNAVIFIPSSFDFIRVHNYFRKEAGVTFAVLSEYSTNQDISRARQAFFNGKKSFLLVSERFHFYRRYKLRGVRNIVFYGPPDHPQFYTEFLSYPFLDDGVDSSDVTSRVLYSKYDWFRMERIVGTGSVGSLVNVS